MPLNAPRLLAVPLVAAGLALTGCSALAGNDAARAPQEAPAEAPTAIDAPTGAPPAAPAPTAPAPAAPAQAAGLVSKEFVSQGFTLRFEIVELKRRGDLMELVARVSDTKKTTGAEDSWRISDYFSADAARCNTSFVFSGAILTDTRNKKRYLVARDSQDNCVASGDLLDVNISVGETVELTATYAAPPADVTSLDVNVVQLGTFRDVPVS